MATINDPSSSEISLNLHESLAGLSFQSPRTPYTPHTPYTPYSPFSQTGTPYSNVYIVPSPLIHQIPSPYTPYALDVPAQYPYSLSFDDALRQQQLLAKQEFGIQPTSDESVEFLLKELGLGNEGQTQNEEAGWNDLLNQVVAESSELKEIPFDASSSTKLTPLEWNAASTANKPETDWKNVYSNVEDSSFIDSATFTDSATFNTTTYNPTSNSFMDSAFISNSYNSPFTPFINPTESVISTTEIQQLTTPQMTPVISISAPDQHTCFTSINTLTSNIQQSSPHIPLKSPSLPFKSPKIAAKSPKPGFKSPHSSTLTATTVKEGSQTLFQCPFPSCQKRYTRPYNLKSHYRVHTGERPFVCELCPLTFTREHDLKRHVKLHDGVKPFECKACGKTFARNDALRRHLRTGDRESVCAVKIRTLGLDVNGNSSRRKKDEDAEYKE